MARKARQYHVLDKDLGRVTYAEHAALASSRPMMRLGLALVFVAAAAEYAAASLAGQPALGIMAASVAVAIFLALSMGGNDVSNALGPPVGAGAIGLTTGLFLVATTEILGAIMAGGAVTRRMAEGIVAHMDTTGTPTAMMMLAALVAAASWISLATWLNATVSTTHSVVGAILGAGVVTFGFDAVHWHVLPFIAFGWIVSPVMSGMLAAVLLAGLHRFVLDREDSIASGRIWLTVLVAAMTGMLVAVAVISFRDLGWRPVLALALAGAAVGAAYAHVMLGREIRRHERQSPALKKLLGVPLVATAMAMGFAHGANNSSNIAAPLSVLLQHITPDDNAMLEMRIVLLLSGLGIAVGVVLFGGRLVTMVGSRITRLNPARSLCISLATAVTVLGFSMAGLPVSTTHIAVGGVFGVGFYREWLDRRNQKERAPLPEEEVQRRQIVRRSHVRTILWAWLITVPLNMALGAALAWLLSL